MPRRSKRQHHRPQQQRPQSSALKYRVGDLVHFHAFASPQDQNTYFMCKGLVARQPTPESKVYKVVVTAVDPKSMLCGHNPKLASTLLGKRIARLPDQLTDQPDGLLSQAYKSSAWLEVEDRELNKIRSNIRRG